MIHLDTSFLIQALVPASRADKRLRQLLHDGQDLAISSIAWTAFLCGPISASEVEVDCMIAAVAIRRGAVLATANPKDFERLASSLALVVP